MALELIEKLEGDGGPVLVEPADAELPALPPEVIEAAERLFQYMDENDMFDGAKDGASNEVMLPCDVEDFLDDLEDEELEEREEAARIAAEQESNRPPRPALVVRSIVTQPKLPLIFQLVVENYNQRMAIHAKGSSITKTDWVGLKELNRDMKQSLRPGAVLALQRATAG